MLIEKKNAAHFRSMAARCRGILLLFIRLVTHAEKIYTSQVYCSYY